MAKHKYNLGDFIQFKGGGEGKIEAGAIEGIVIRKIGVSYLVSGKGDTISETDVIALYRQVKRRVSKKTTPKTTQDAVPAQS